MTIYNIDKIFKPASVAVIGASETEGTIGNSLMRNIVAGEFPGDVFPINPKHDTIMDLRAYKSISQIKKPVDLAVIATPIAKTPDIIRECCRAGVGGVVIISAGGKEIGSKGKRLEAEIKSEAAKGGIRIIGPNCAGVICTGANLHATFAGQRPLPGKLAFVSQSGALCGSILDLSVKEQIGFSHFVSIGSMLDVDFGDLINYLGNDPRVSSIVLYIESLSNIRKFMSAARAVSRVKPIVVLKAGRSKAGARAASSHTGALAGEDAVYDAAFKRAGVVRVKTIEELFDCAELMAKQPVPSGSGLAVITNGGGPGVMAADSLSAYGVEPVELKPETIEKLDAVLPAFWSKGNPIDILGDASPDRWRRALEVCLEAREIQGLVIIFVPQSISDASAVAQVIVELLYEKPYPPIYSVWMGGDSVEKGRRILNNAGIPTYDTPERAVSAFIYMHSYARNLEMSLQVPPKVPASLLFDRSGAKEIVGNALKEGITLLTEVESKALLQAYGIPVNPTEVAASAGEAVSLAKKIGYPVAMKIYSRDIVHKSDANGVQLDLQRDEDVGKAFEKMMTDARAYNPKARLEGVSIQTMLKRPDYELILGSKTDADFGPVILFGMGGTLTEICKDHAIALPPLNRLLAQRLMESTRIYQVLKGYRNRPPADLERLEIILIGLAQLVTDFPEIEELDINPMIFTAEEACAVDARVIVKPSGLSAPHHLVISPYPNQYETISTTEAGQEIFIRPIRPEDAPLLVDFFETLSAESVYYRFFTPVKHLSAKTIAFFTQIDYDRDMALVAMDNTRGKESILGVARIMTKPGGTEPEFAVTVSDDWQGKGIGATLLEHLIAIARERGFETLWGVVLAGNRYMLALAKKLGFRIEKGQDSGEFELTVNLK